MAEVKWIKITTDIFDDEKIKLIEALPEADSILVIWFKILCLAGRSNKSGLLMMNDKIYYTDEMLASLFNRPLNTVRFALKTFQNFSMVEMINDSFYISNWEKHQNIDGLEKIREQGKLRNKKYRERLKISSCDVTRDAICDVTVTGCDAIEQEQDKEQELDKEKETTTTTSGDSEFNIFIYMQQNGFVSISPMMMEKVNADIEIYSLEEVKQAVEIADSNGKHTYSYVRGILEKRRAGLGEGKYGNSKQNTESSSADYDFSKYTG